MRKARISRVLAVLMTTFMVCRLCLRTPPAVAVTPDSPEFDAQARRFSAHRKPVDSVAFSPDGRYLASGSFDNTVKIWEVSTGKVARTIKAPGDLYLTIPRIVGVFAVAFSPDGHYLASAGWSNVVGLWRMPSGEELRTIRGWNWDWVVPAKAAFVDCVAFSPDSRYIATGGGDKVVRVADVEGVGGVQKFRGHTRLVRTVAFSPDGHYLVSGSWDETVRVWDPKTGNALRMLGGRLGVVDSVAFSPDGLCLAAGTGNDITLWNVATWEEMRKIKGHTDRVRAVAFSPSGRYLASGSNDFTVRLWDVESGQPLGTFAPRKGSITSVAFSPDGRSLASGSGDGAVVIWGPKN